jgi:hypothetical protein
MICPYCGEETSERSTACNHCGRWLLDAKKAPPSQTSLAAQAALPGASPAAPGSSVPQADVPIEGQPLEAAGVADHPAVQSSVSSSALITPVKASTKSGLDKWSLGFIGCFILFCLIFSCSAVCWLLFSFSTVFDSIKSPTEVPTSLPTADPSPALNLQYSDDFSDPTSGWPISNETDYVNDYYQGGYRMLDNEVNTTSWAYPDMDTFSDVSVEVDATKIGGPDENNMGVICRFQNNDEFYYGLVTSDGYYAIVKSTTEDFIVIGREYIEYSDLINQGEATNHIRLDCIGDVLTLYVNGQLIDRQTDTDYTSGQAGLIIATYDTPGTDILFDNFNVYEP